MHSLPAERFYEENELMEIIIWKENVEIKACLHIITSSLLLEDGVEIFNDDSFLVV